MGEGLDRTQDQQGAQGGRDLIVLGTIELGGGDKILTEIVAFTNVRYLCIPSPLAWISKKRAHTALPMMWQESWSRRNGCQRGVGGGKRTSDCCVFFVAIPLIFRHVRNLSIPPPPLAGISTKQEHTALPVMWRLGALRLNGCQRATCGGRCGGGLRPCVLILDKLPMTELLGRPLKCALAGFDKSKWNNLCGCYFIANDEVLIGVCNHK